MARPVPAREGVTGQPGRRAEPPGGWPRLLKLAVPLLLLMATAGPFAFSWAMAPASVRVRGDVVRIARRLAPPIDLPLARVAHVAPLRAAELAGFRRLTGTAFGEVSYGTYRTDALGAFELYAGRRGGYVLLEGPDLRVVVTPDDPAAFTREVEARIGGL